MADSIGYFSAPIGNDGCFFALVGYGGISMRANRRVFKPP